MRPTYETQADRNNERRLAAKIEKHYNCHLSKMPISIFFLWFVSNHCFSGY
mgnify:CR=1 FL=1